jgi:uncharacterized membrane protein
LRHELDSLGHICAGGILVDAAVIASDLLVNAMMPYDKFCSGVLAFVIAWILTVIIMSIVGPFQ